MWPYPVRQAGELPGHAVAGVHDVVEEVLRRLKATPATEAGRLEPTVVS
jgi:hypothetical protein